LVAKGRATPVDIAEAVELGQEWAEQHGLKKQKKDPEEEPTAYRDRDLPPGVVMRKDGRSGEAEGQQGLLTLDLTEEDTSDEFTTN
jgi:hypothetical protein